MPRFMAYSERWLWVSFDKILDGRLINYVQRDELLGLRKENEVLSQRITKLEGQRLMPEKEWFTVKDLEPVMRKSESTIRKNFIATGKIKAQLIGGRYRIAAKEFKRIEDSVYVNGGCWKLEGF
ncbi:hypothetical protein N9Z38_02995 [Mariniblastus sp.]|nr:hypothetical protein [Mariniblastus sp.]